MNKSEQQYLAGWVDDHLEAYVDGELSPEDRRRIEAFIREDEEARRQLRIAERVRVDLRSMSTPACPPEVSAVVLAAARSDSATSGRTDREPVPGRRRRGAALVENRFSRAWSAVLRPSLAVGLFVLVVIASALLGRPPSGTGTPDVATQAEVEQALQEVKWTLAYVSDVGRRTGQSIRREVLEERVALPVQRVLNDAVRTEPTG